MFNVLFMFRRLAFTIILFYMSDYPVLQIIGLNTLSYIMLLYLIHVKPFTLSILNTLEIINETCILLCCSHLLLFTDFVDDPSLHSKCGLTLIGLTLLVMAINLGAILVTNVRQVRIIIMKIA